MTSAPLETMMRTRLRVEVGVLMTAIAMQFLLLGIAHPWAVHGSQLAQMVGTGAVIVILAKYRWHRGSVRIDCVVKGSAGLLAVATSLYCVHLRHKNILPADSAMLESAVDSLFYFGLSAAAMFWVTLAATVGRSNKSESGL